MHYDYDYDYDNDNDKKQDTNSVLKLVEGKKCPEKLTFSCKTRKIFCQFSHFFKTFSKLKEWFLIMILMANQPI